MHLLAAKPGAIADGAEAVDLGQTPGDIVILSAADTELACLAEARRGMVGGLAGGMAGDFPSLRLANLMQLSHNMSVDLYVEEVIAHAKLVIVRLIGGTGYWPYGVEQIAMAAERHGIQLAFLPGDDQPDPELSERSTLATETVHRLWQYLVQGGVDNAGNLLASAATLIGRNLDWREPAPLMRAGLYWPGDAAPDLSAVRAHWPAEAAVVPIVFYRALVQAGNTAPVDALIAALAERGLGALPIFVSGLKDPVSAALVEEFLATTPPRAILNATGFATSKPGAPTAEGPFTASDCPVFQIVFSGSDRESWAAGSHGLGARDIAMNVALPEVDGRILARALSFKAESRYDEATQCGIVAYEPVADRISFTADLTAAWARLAAKLTSERRVALILANYPNRDGRLGNGVGLDTPASAVAILEAMAAAGYEVSDRPADGETLMARLLAGPTNKVGDDIIRTGGAELALADYERFFSGLPDIVQTQVTERWGAPATDPFVRDGAFRLAVLDLGHTLVAIQPARGYNIDPKATYHDPALVPPHGYLAFYLWLRKSFGADAVVHLGKHGNLEWLPGKALALSSECWPEVALGPLPNLYPFIVNDPGEGTQAKRRTAAVIIDHLTPPMTRAESYGPLKEMEVLVDEYYEASGLDPRRLKLLGREIVDLAEHLGLERDCGIAPGDGEDEKLAKLDNHLCELKELQIRDGLHILGSSPKDGLLVDLLVALARVPRVEGKGGDASLHRAISADLGLEGFDPLATDFATPWTGGSPDALKADGPWRTNGDTVERIESLAADLIAGTKAPVEAWLRTRAVLETIETVLHPAVAASGAAEIAGLLTGLDGRFVPPGPSGAPTRGRPEVLPTGRNFYSVDTRAVPTPTAWKLGWKSAGLLLERYRQDNGEWPKRLALSAWGTANMRTGGDDIAQALALMGVRPDWETASGRVVGFEIMPLSVLDRPRVDVTFRISGFFRDAFPAQIDLLDSAARAVAEQDEPEAMNPLAARVRADVEALTAKGIDPAAAKRRAGHRVFGSKPGAYGAGLQALIDEKIWDTESDLAEAYLAWGGYAYGDGAEGRAEQDLFSARLKDVELVLHNQDNREHDLLDSDDYYQFEGGIAAAIHHLSGQRPEVYHNDHSRPEAPRVFTLGQEIGRVVRARAANPKWIEGVMRHGYKGAFEMAATVDYLFAFAATTGVVSDQHFDAVHDAYLGDDAVLAFLERHNPAALAEMAERFKEALDRGLWRARSNTARARLEELIAGSEATV